MANTKFTTMPPPRYGNLLSRYRRYAPGYDRRFARYSEATLERAAGIVPANVTHLVDVACGTGLFIAKVRARRPAARITGIDISQEMLAQAQRRFMGDSAVRFADGVAESLPLAEASCDVVSCNNAFHLVQDAGAALREFHRVLEPGGRVIIVDWCLDYPQVAVMAAALRVADRQVRRIRSVSGLTALLEEHGFDNTQSERFRVPPLWGLMAVTATRPAGR